MSLLGATKISAIAFSIVGLTSGGVFGLSYFLQSEDLNPLKWKSSWLKNSVIGPIKQASEFSSESIGIGKSRTNGGYFCRGWIKETGGVVMLKDKDCEEKVKSLWKGNVENQPQMWFRSDRETSAKFFEDKGFIEIGRERRDNPIIREKEGSWNSANGWECKHWENKENEGKIVVICD
ncbi:hypothetical protein [Mycoplasma suis]|uniref:Uncharacterized protein n=2 Tax=Mycoplasma suis TaxID=57372 RepID=F0QQC5_MYCSL|nr:hypothetical protein [Mycoplasma suis]ADX97695.1 hypothetical protein MSU_0151 [Mycoplasma suis str. Illinois]CBZ40235.1 hypothetical protein MSUIS_01420 [Mycoplasma suis KI3806]